MKNLDIHILMGLPGSGKSYWARENLYDKGLYANYSINVDLMCSFKNTSDGLSINIENIIRDFFAINKSNISIKCGCSSGVNTKACQIIFDNLTLTNSDLQKVVGLFIKYGGNITYEGEVVPLNFIIHQWDENREACLANDPLRLYVDGGLTRTKKAENTIRYAPYEIANIDYLKKEYPNCTFEYVEHTVKAYSRMEMLIDDYNGTIKSEKWCIGGDRCDCWGGHWVKDDEDEPEPFTEFDNIINFYCPNISHQNYTKLWNACVEEEIISEPDYYGGCMRYKYYYCNLESLFKMMEEMNIIENR